MTLKFDSKSGQFIDDLNGESLTSKILYGKEEPDESIGGEGDFYINTFLWKIYQRDKRGWGEGIKLIGKNGVDGKNGLDGLNGKDGVDGLGIDGADGKDGVGIADIAQPLINKLEILLTNGETKSFLIPHGKDAREIELKANSTHIQWRYMDGDWSNLAELPKPAYGGGRMRLRDLADYLVAGSNISINTNYATKKIIISGSASPVGQALTRTNDANVTLTLGGAPSTALLQATSITVGWSGVLAITRGGTNANNESDAVFNLGSALPDGVASSEDPIGTRIHYIAYNDSTGQSFSFLGADIQSAISTSLSGTYQPLDSDLTALANNTTNGFWARTGAGAGAARTITGTANEITVTNGAGTAGNPTLSIPTAVTFTGKTITGGAYENASIGNTTPATIVNVDNLRLDANTLSSTNTNGAINVQPNGTGAVNFGNIAGGNFWSNDSTGYLFGNGTAVLGVNIDKYAFLVPGSLAGLFFRFLLGVPGQVALDLFGQEIASIDYSGTDSVVNAVYGFANGMVSPASIGANQNNYAGFAGGGIVRLTSSGAFNITGAVAPTNSRAQQKYIYNVGANNITLTHEDAASTAANRFRNTTLANITLAADEAAICNYDTVTARWRCSKL